MTDPYPTESAHMDAHRAEWSRDHLGECVVIDGTRLIGFYPTLEEALTLGTVACFIAEVTPEPLTVVIPRLWVT